MTSAVYQVIEAYETLEETERNDYLLADKGALIVDCKVVDENWFRGKNIANGEYGLIPKANVVVLQSNDYSDVDPTLRQKLQEEGLLKNIGELRENPLQEALDDLDASDLLKKRGLSKFRDQNYVEMSSGETLNMEVDAEMKPVENEKRKVNPLPKPPRLSFSTHDHKPRFQDSRGSDEGYNSASHYSGENAESNTPLLTEPKVSKQDEAGYEVPNVECAVNDTEEIPIKSSSERKKKKTFVSLWRKKSTDSKHSGAEEIRENFYDPPADFRDSYFLPQTEHPTTRVLLSFIAALGIAVTLLLSLILLTNRHPALCFSVSAVVFTIFFVVPVTILHRGIFCVTALIVPSMVANKTKIAVITVLVIMFVLGPVFGIADKLHIARTCSHNKKQWFSSDGVLDLPFPSGAGQPYRECFSKLSRVNQFCRRNFDGSFSQLCKTNFKTYTADEKRLCNKTTNYFCRSDKMILNLCINTAQPNMTVLNGTHIPPKVEFSRRFREAVLYLLPLLFLLLLSEAYSYNKVYLTTKDTDNIYITQRLKELDCERRNRGLTDLILPLTRIEFQTYLVRRTLGLSKDEQNKVYKWLLIFLSTTFVAISLVLIEEYIHKTLLYTQTEQCLTYYELHSSIRFREIIYSLLGALLFLIIVQSHVLRLRSVICNYIYPEMVEIRAKYLYYKILHDRHSFARHVRRKIQLLSEEKRLRQRISFSSQLYAVLPLRLKWVCRKLSVSRCMICDSMSYRKTVECTNKGCRAHYCYECYVDAGQTCLTCGVTPSSTSASA